ncbi:hypothetical protein GJU40_15005 [Bacillus lacus]|uniref:Uncharacterized protein n=1 Tax=Metabacillus lacus TaxID=1983721 RepID=A0A7X2J182_9BACI|nr:hypothetical protein [Metabacillus lacus]MRX73451.1 hypothetical protein [Metabacillus lacus]
MKTTNWKRIIVWSLVGLSSIFMIGFGFLVIAFIMIDDTQPKIEKDEAREAYDIYNQPPTVEEMIVNPKETTKGEFGHQTVTHYEGEGIDSVVVDKSEYMNAKAFVDDLYNLLNGDTENRVPWDSKFEKQKYYAGSIIVYVNHFVNNQSVGDYEAIQLRELKAVAVKVHNATNEAEQIKPIEQLKIKLSKVYSSFGN